jgi:hypothetical protein
MYEKSVIIVHEKPNKFWETLSLEGLQLVIFGPFLDLPSPGMVIAFKVPRFKNVMGGREECVIKLPWE